MSHNGGPTRVIGIGASAGGHEALFRVLGAIPPELPHVICVTLHVSATSEGRLAGILDRRSAVPVVTAEQGMPLEAGRVYVAPPDCHLLVEAGHVLLSSGPKENGVRPAVDAMLRSIAAYGAAAVAVVLSGALGDGSDGARLVLRAGGEVIVQDPRDAVVASMPERAIGLVGDAARVLPAAEIGRALAALEPLPHPLTQEAPVNGSARREPENRRPEGLATGFTCPECSGAIWEEHDGDIVRYRCRIGHAYSEDAMVTHQGASLEAALWAALEMIEERAELLRKVAERRGSHAGLRRRLTAAADDADARAKLIRSAVSANGEALTVAPVSSAAP